jgi:hypothetical protein
MAPLSKRLFVCATSVGLVLLTTAGTWVMGPGKGTHGGGFPTNGLLDNFNRADESPLGNGNWTELLSSAHDSARIVSNAVVRVGTVQKAGMYWSASQFTANQEVYFTISTKTDQWMDLLLRLTNPAGSPFNGYAISIEVSAGTDVIAVNRKDDDANTLLGSTFSQEITNGDGVGASIVGSTITVYYRSGAGAWTALGTRTDSTYSGAGHIGFAGNQNGTSWTMDDFGGGSL